MNYFQKRKRLKWARQLMHEARHTRHMREDVAAAADIDRLHQIEQALREARKQRDFQRIDKLAEQLQPAVETVAGKPDYPRIREHVEILIVAVAVAMGFRAFFFQPFKIPTGSMQPTLYGITVEEAEQNGWGNRFPFSLVKTALLGKYDVTVQAKATGYLDLKRRRESSDGALLIPIGGKYHKIRQGMKLFRKPDDYYEKGDIIAAGRVVLGDHIFVNKLKYNFTRPARGDVFVFKTAGIDHPRIRQNTYYIKRCAGLPDDHIRIEEPFLVANDAVVTNPPIFKYMTEAPGYNGYLRPMQQNAIRRDLTAHIGQPEVVAVDDSKETGRAICEVSLNISQPVFLPVNTGPFVIGLADSKDRNILNSDGYLAQRDMPYVRIDLDFEEVGGQTVIPPQSVTTELIVAGHDAASIGPALRVYSLFISIIDLQDEIHLQQDEYLPLGDNTQSSLDGRYFGAVNRKRVIGPASVVYWPLSERWGWIH